MLRVEAIGEYNFRIWTFRVFGDPKNPLFVAADVARAIDHSVGHTNDMIAQVDDDEKVYAVISLSPYNNGSQTGRRGGYRDNRPQWLLTRDGVREVIMQSRKPIAKEYKAVIKQVLKEMDNERGIGWENSYFEDHCYYDEESDSIRYFETGPGGEPK